MTGSHTGSGGNSVAYKFDTHSVWDPNLPPPATAFASGWGTGSGGWALNGTSSGSDWFHSEFHSSNNGGTGKYDFAEDFGYDAPAGGAPAGGPAGGAPGNPNPPTQRGNKTGSAVITESRFELNSGSSSWDATLGADGEWALTNGSETSSGSSSDDFTMIGNGGFQTYLNPAKVGTFSVHTERHNRSDYHQNGTVHGGAWMMDAGGGSGSGSTLDQFSSVATGRINLPSKTGNSIGYTTGESDSNNDSFRYDTTYAVLNGAWNVTGTASATSSGSASTSTSIIPRNYARPIAGGKISGTLHDFETGVSNDEFHSGYTLDANGNWVLSSGTGSEYAGEGEGRGYSGNGAYATSAAVPFWGLTWTISGTVDESESESATAGESIAHSVVNGQWVAAAPTAAGTIATAKSITNKATGTYGRGTVSGTFKRNEADSSDSSMAFALVEVTGSTTGATTMGSGTRSEHWKTANDWSYNGTGTMIFEGAAGTLTESGSGSFSAFANGDFTRVAQPLSLDGDGWVQSSGSRGHDSEAEYHADFSHNTPFTVTGPNGSSGFNALHATEDNTFVDRMGEEFQNAKWSQTSGYKNTTARAMARAWYSSSGDYTTPIDGGSITGRASADGHDEVNVSFIEGEKYLGFGISFKWAFGESHGDAKSHSSYDGNGTYTRLSMPGTSHASGSSDIDSKFSKKYALMDDTWKAQGTLDVNDAGEDHFTYKANGNYTSTGIGRIGGGPTSESGFNDGKYDLHGHFQLGAGESWVLTSGTGSASGSGSWSYNLNGGGTYERNNFVDGANLLGTFGESETLSGSYSYSNTYEVANRNWTANGGGAIHETRGKTDWYTADGQFNVTLSGPIDPHEDHITRHEELHLSYSSQYDLTWTETPASGLGWTSDFHSTNTSTGNYTHSATGSSDHFTEVGNYAAGNGIKNTVHNEYNRSRSESWRWTVEEKAHTVFGAAGRSENSDKTTTGSGDGNAHDFKKTTTTSNQFTTTSTYGLRLDRTEEEGHDREDHYHFDMTVEEKVAPGATEPTRVSTLDNQVWGGGWDSDTFEMEIDVTVLPYWPLGAR